jgi:hypothetical protein
MPLARPAHQVSHPLHIDLLSGQRKMLVAHDSTQMIEQLEWREYVGYACKYSITNKINKIQQIEFELLRRCACGGIGYIADMGFKSS